MNTTDAKSGTHNLFSLSGRTIVVTGGAGHIGRPLCVFLQESGAEVLCLSSRTHEFPVAESGPGTITSEACDVRDESAFLAAVEGFAETRNGIDCLVNNASRAPRGIDFDISREDVNAVFDNVFTHYFTCSRALLPLFRDNRSSIVNNATIWGMVSPDPRVHLDLKNEPSFALGPAKAAILNLTKYMAVMLAPKGIRVNAVVPGWFPQRRGPDNPDYMHQIESRIPMGRIGQPSELAGVIAFLLSDAASYITGQSLIVDGGYTIW